MFQEHQGNLPRGSGREEGRELEPAEALKLRGLSCNPGNTSSRRVSEESYWLRASGGLVSQQERKRRLLLT